MIITKHPTLNYKTKKTYNMSDKKGDFIFHTIKNKDEFLDIITDVKKCKTIIVSYNKKNYNDRIIIYTINSNRKNRIAKIHNQLIEEIKQGYFKIEKDSDGKKYVNGTMDTVNQYYLLSTSYFVCRSNKKIL